MTLFLRDKKNRTIVDCDIYIKDSEYVELSIVVCVDTYSRLLLDLITKNGEEKTINKFIQTFDELQELRGWLWESYFIDGDNNPSEYNIVLETIRKRFKEIADTYELYYVED